MSHLSLDALIHFADSLEGEQLSHLPHLLGCEACRARATRMLSELAPEGPQPLEPAASRIYESVFGRLEDHRSDFLTDFAEASGRVDEELDALLALPAKKRGPAFRKHKTAEALAILLRLLERAYLATFESPSRASQLADLALEFCFALDPAQVAPTHRTDLEARARMLGAYADSLEDKARGANDIRFRLAENNIAHPDSVEAAVFCRLLGSVRGRTGRMVEAVALLGHAVRLFKEGGELVEAANASSEQAVLYAKVGDLGRSLALLTRSVSLKEAWTPPEQAVRERILLAVLHAAVDHPNVAAEVMAEAEARAVRASVELPALFALARAALAAHAGNRKAAERHLAAALEAAIAEESYGEAATALFHLAILHSEAGRQAELLQLADTLQQVLVPGHLPPALRVIARRFQGELRTGQARLERLMVLRRNFQRAIPSAPGPLQGLVLLIDEALLQRLLPPPSPFFLGPGMPPGAGSLDQEN